MYNYQELRSYVFTDEGQRLFLKIRDRMMKLIEEAGACRSGEVTNEFSGDSWNKIACIDRLVELGEIIEIENPRSSAGQYRIFTR